MPIKQLQFSFFSQNSLAHLGWENKILILQDQNKKFMKFLQTLDFNSKEMCLMLFSKGQRLFMEQFWIKLVVILLRKPFIKCVADSYQLYYFKNLFTRKNIKAFHSYLF